MDRQPSIDEDIPHRKAKFVWSDDSIFALVSLIEKHHAYKAKYGASAHAWLKVMEGLESLNYRPSQSSAHAKWRSVVQNLKRRVGVAPLDESLLLPHEKIILRLMEDTDMHHEPHDPKHDTHDDDDLYPDLLNFGTLPSKGGYLPGSSITSRSVSDVESNNGEDETPGLINVLPPLYPQQNLLPNSSLSTPPGETRPYPPKKKRKSEPSVLGCLEDIKTKLDSESQYLERSKTEQAVMMNELKTQFQIERQSHFEENNVMQQQLHSIILMTQQLQQSQQAIIGALSMLTEAIRHLSQPVPSVSYPQMMAPSYQGVLIPSNEATMVPSVTSYQDAYSGQGTFFQP